MVESRIESKQKMLFSYNRSMNALDVYTKINIKDYLANPEESKDKNYSKKRQEIRKYIRKDDLDAKRGHPKGQIDWAYLLRMADSF
tara:strand:- start:246 stop:503 length:258 start_codon:yes stop_codon:yes gene_type:complete